MPRRFGCRTLALIPPLGYRRVARNIALPPPAPRAKGVMGTEKHVMQSRSIRRSGQPATLALVATIF